MFKYVSRILFIFLLPLQLIQASDDVSSIYGQNDIPLAEPLTHPDWFKESFLELDEDLQEAIDNGKKGLVVYFGQQRCAYCLKLMKINFGMQDIVDYTRQNFDVVGIDIWNVQEITTPDGQVMTERQYAIRENTNFTPSLIFYDRDGRIALRLRGYYPPYQFRAALKYVVEEYYKQETFNHYLARGDNTRVFEPGELNEEDFYNPGPYTLDRSKIPGSMPLAVFFETGDCHACDIMHTQPLRKKSVQNALNAMDSIQLDVRTDTPVITPDGTKTTAKEWAKQLNLYYTPAIVFFDPNGKEILRIDSVVQLYRLRGILNYIGSGAYKSFPTFQTWRAKTLSQAKKQVSSGMSMSISTH